MNADEIEEIIRQELEYQADGSDGRVHPLYAPTVAEADNGKLFVDGVIDVKALAQRIVREMQRGKIPDRLSVDISSPHYSKDVKKIGVRFNGTERRGDVVEYCVSEGWVRVWLRDARGNIITERGNPRIVKLNGRVDPYRLTV